MADSTSPVNDHPLSSKGLFVPLDVNYADDPKVIEVGPLAELLYVRSLAFAKRIGNRIGSDGRIHRNHLIRLGVDLTDDAGAPIYDMCAKRLVDAELWVEEPDGSYRIAAWEKWNLTVEEIEERRRSKAEGGALGNHRRWHTARGEVDPDCTYCTGSDHRSDSDSVEGSVSESTKTEKETETSNERPPKVDAFADEFTEWWAKYPRRVQRAAALKAYQARRRDGTDPGELVRARDEYARSVAGTEAQFVMHAATFLRGRDGPWSEWVNGAPEKVSSGKPGPVADVGRRFYPGTGWIEE